MVKIRVATRSAGVIELEAANATVAGINDALVKRFGRPVEYDSAEVVPGGRTATPRQAAAVNSRRQSSSAETVARLARGGR